MHINLPGFAIALFVAVQPAGAALITTEDFHAAQPHGASPLLLPRLPVGEASSTVLLEAALFNVVRHEMAARPAGSVTLVPRSRRPRERALLQFGSAALSQGAVYAHSMVGLFDLLGNDVWRQFALPEWSEDEISGVDTRAPASLDALHSDVAVSLYSILGATAFAASPFYLALGTLAAETLLAIPVEPMPPLALFLAAGIAGAVLIGRRRSR